MIEIVCHQIAALLILCMPLLTSKSSNQPTFLIHLCHTYYFRLIQKGGKTLKDRSRSLQVDMRLQEIGKEIAHIRRIISTKPK